MMKKKEFKVWLQILENPGKPLTFFENNYKIPLTTVHNNVKKLEKEGFIYSVYDKGEKGVEKLVYPSLSFIFSYLGKKGINRETKIKFDKIVPWNIIQEYVKKNKILLKGNNPMFLFQIITIIIAYFQKPGNKAIIERKINDDPDLLRLLKGMQSFSIPV